jgi:hypothetical protein
MRFLPWQKRNLQFDIHREWFWSKFCVATNGVMRFSVCGSVWRYTLFYFPQSVWKRDYLKVRLWGDGYGTMDEKG